MRLRFLFSALALLSALSAAEAPPDPRIAAVENGLLPPILIAGHPAEQWSIATRMKHYHVPGVSIAVIDHRAIAWARGYGVASIEKMDAVTPATLFQAASISKPVTSAAALTLVEAGKLPLDSDINGLLKSWKLPASPVAEGEPVTLRRLLSHTAGITIHGFAGYAAGESRPTLLQVLDGQPPANSSPIRLFLKPGTAWRYSGGGYCIVQQLLLDTVGGDFPALVRDRVLTPAGMTDSTFAQPLPAELAARAATGYDTAGRPIPGGAHIYPELAAAGLWTTPTDLARFALALEHSLTGEAGPKILSRTMAETMISVPLAGSDYGLGIGVKGTGDRLQLSHNGANDGFRALLVAYPKVGRGAVIMTNGDNGGTVAYEIVRSIAQAYGWPDFQPETRQAFPLSPGTFDDFVGRYERENKVVVFLRRGDRFYVHMTGQPRLEIFASSDHEFFSVYRPDTFAFVRDKAGRVTHVLRHIDGDTQLFPRVD